MSIKVNTVPRGSGKTTWAIQTAKFDPSVAIIIPDQVSTSFYTQKGLRYNSQIFTVYSFMRAGSLDMVKRIIVDEGLFGKKEFIELYYELGCRGKDVIVLGSEEE